IEAKALRTLAGRCGLQEQPDFIERYIKPTWGEESPLTAEEMAEMKAGEIFARLAAFTPHDTCFGPTPRRAAQLLQEEIVRRPAEFVAVLDALPDLRYPIYY